MSSESNPAQNGKPEKVIQTKHFGLNLSQLLTNTKHAIVGFGLMLFWIALIALVIFIGIKLWAIASPRASTIDLIFLVPGVLVVLFLWYVSYIFALDLLNTHGMRFTGWAKLLVFIPAIPLMLIMFLYDIFSSIGASAKSLLFSLLGKIFSLAFVLVILYLIIFKM